MGQRERTPPWWPDSQLCGPRAGWRAGVPVSTETCRQLWVPEQPRPRRPPLTSRLCRRLAGAGPLQFAVLADVSQWRNPAPNPVLK